MYNHQVKYFPFKINKFKGNQLGKHEQSQLHYRFDHFQLGNLRFFGSHSVS